MKPETVGEIVDRRGPCALFAAVVRLAEKRGRIPVGRWHLPLETPWELKVNGTADAWESIPPWHAMILRADWPILLFDAADGIQIGGGDPPPETTALEVLRRAIEATS